MKGRAKRNPSERRPEALAATLAAVVTACVLVLFLPRLAASTEGAAGGSSAILPRGQAVAIAPRSGAQEQLLQVAGAGGSEGAAALASLDPSPRLVYPPPPARARIEYVGSIEDNRACLEKKGWWRKLVSLFAGKEKPVDIARPYGLAVSRDGVLYVCDTGAKVVHGLSPGKGYRRIPRKGELEVPIDVAVDGEGKVYVTDSKAGAVYRFDQEGHLELTFAGPLSRPTGIAYHHETDRIYVVDTAAHCLRVYTRDGRPVATYGSRGAGKDQFNFPTAISVGSDGLLYVTDAMNFRIQILSPSGEFLGSFGKLGDGTGDFSKPKGVAVDSEGHVYVVDAIFDVVQVFDREGQLLLAFGRAGRDPGEFWLPTGITIDEKDRIYVADTYNGRIQVFRYLGGER